MAILRSLVRALVGDGHQSVRLNRAEQSVPTGRPQSQLAGGASGVAYPPKDPGLPVVAAEVLLNDHRDLMSMLRQHAAEAPARFATRFEAPILRLADYINVVPGTSTEAFGGAGGLLRACLENAFASFRASDGRIFTGAMGVEERHRLEGRWRYICFCVGLLYPIGLPLGSMSVLDQEGEKWQPETDSLARWAQECDTHRVFVTWAGSAKGSGIGPAPITATFAVSIIGRENVQWLNDGAPDLILTLLTLITGSAGGRDSIAGNLVEGVWRTVLAREEARRVQNYGRLTVGTHVGPYLLSAMESLAGSAWAVNKQTLFADATGVYLTWPKAGEDIVAHCKERGYQGVPSSPQALLSMLIKEGLVEPGFEGVSQVEICADGGEVEMAVKVTQPALLFPADMDLSAFAKVRPVLMTAVVAQDPMAPSKSDQGVLPGPTDSEAKSAPLPTGPKLEQLDIATVLEGSGEAAVDEGSQVLTSDGNVMGSQAVILGPRGQDEGEGGSENRPAKLPQKSARGEGVGIPAAETGGSSNALVEVPEIKYATLLSSEVVDRFKTHERELLGRLVHMFRTKAAEGKIMRMCENGLAVEVALLGDYTRDPVAFLSALGKEGFLYTAPSTPAKMAYPVPVSEGAARSLSCFILAHHALKKLGLP